MRTKIAATVAVQSSLFIKNEITSRVKHWLTLLELKFNQHPDPTIGASRIIHTQPIYLFVITTKHEINNPKSNYRTIE